MKHSRERSLTNSPSRLPLDYFWISTILLLIWFFTSITPLPPNDLWWHMAAGRTMVEEAAWMFTNRWAYTVPNDAVFVLQSWLSELLLYGLWKVGDVPLLALSRTLAISLGYGLMAWQAWRQTLHGKAVTVALLLAILVGWNNWTLRPQTLSIIPAVSFVFILREYLQARVSARWLVALPLIMLVWVNMHGSFMLGVGLSGLAWLGTGRDALHRRKDPTTAAQTAQARTQLVPLTLSLVAILLATLGQPLGVGIYAYVKMTISHPLHNQWFVEWLPPTNDLNVLNTGFWFFSILLLLAARMARSRQPVNMVDVLWYAALAWLTIGGVRYAMWFGLLLLPLMAEQLAPLVQTKQRVFVHPRFVIGYALVAAIAVVALLPWMQPARWLGPGAAPLFASSGKYRWLLSSTTPVGGTAWLEAHPQDGRFWADMSYTSYTLWRMPDKQVFVDLRVELFPKSVWQDYFAITRGDAQSLALLDSWDISHIMLDHHWEESLYHTVVQSPAWCEEYIDSRTAIFVRCREQ